MSVDSFHAHLKHFFNNKTIEDLVGKNREIFYFEPSQTIESCMQLFHQKSVRSAPVRYDGMNAKSDVRFVDFMDILAYLVEFCDQHYPTLDQEETYAKFMNVPVENIANYSKSDKYDVVYLGNATAMDAAKKLLLDTSVKRVLVLDANDQILNIITLSDVLNLMKEYVDSCNASGDEQRMRELQLTAEQLCIDNKAPVCVSEEMIALDAFKVMFQARQSFVPVLSGTSLLSVISVRDIKVLVSAIAQEQFGKSLKAMSLSVMDFIGLTRQASPDDKYPYISCKGCDTIELIVKRLRATHVHRLLLINDQKHPVGVVSITSVCKQVIIS